MLSPEQINELHRLEDDALVDTREAAAFLGLAVATLNWVRSNAPCRGPKFCRVGTRTVRYRLGDLRAFICANEGRP